MTGRLLKFAYQLWLHRFGRWGLDEVFILGTWGAAIFILASWLVRGKPPVPAWHWAAWAALLAAGAAMVGLRTWAARRQYLLFEPEPDLPLPVAQALAPEDKLLIRATGRFEVEGKSHFFADLLAYWRSFATREHAVMAIIHESRFLLLGTVPEHEIGMWYIFFRPEDIVAITPGQLTFGAAVRPALCVTYNIVPTAPPGKNQRKKPIRDTAYLIFDDEAARAAVWADLKSDAGG